jgi:hypothetical protein
VNEKLKFERKLLRDWLNLEEIRGNILEAADRSNYSELSLKVEQYVSAVSNCKWKITTWFDAVETFEAAVKANLPVHQFALLRTRAKNEKLPWEYEGRTWYYWLHLFSSTYG